MTNKIKVNKNLVPGTKQIFMKKRIGIFNEMVVKKRCWDLRSLHTETQWVNMIGDQNECRKNFIDGRDCFKLNTKETMGLEQGLK